MNADTSLPRCRYCGESVSPSDAAPTHAYWNAMQFVCHKACKQEGIKQEAYDCQCIDADCNDCGYFKRGKELLFQKGEWKISLGWTGTCLRDNKATKAFPKMCTGRKCFVHRRDLLKPTDP